MVGLWPTIRDGSRISTNSSAVVGCTAIVLEFDAQAALAEDPQAAALREVILSLDVPQTPPSAEPFPTWQKVAHALAGDMDADLLDDVGRPITLHALEAIGRDLGQLYADLESHDPAAGSPAARRLFAG